MILLKEILALLQKEFLLELRQKYAISGILLYVLSTVFIVYLSFIEVQAQVWNTLFWIIILFTSVNAITKSFVQENSARQLYYYSIANPSAVLLAKIIYNVILLGLLSLIAFLIFSLVTINPIRDQGLFFTALFLGSTGFGIAFTFISAISAKASNNATLMAILGFPVIIPIIMTLIKISANAIGLISDTEIWKDILTLVAIDTILIALTFVLFPYLWRD